METIPVIRRLQPRKFHESHLQSILPAEAPTSSTTAAVAPTSCTTAAVAPTSCTTPAVAPTSSTTPPEALTSSTKPPEAVSPCIAAGRNDAKPDGVGGLEDRQPEEVGGFIIMELEPLSGMFCRYREPFSAASKTNANVLNVTFGRADLQLEPDLEMDTLFAHNMKTKIKAQLHREPYRQF